MILIIKHISIEGPGTIGEFLKETDWDAKTIELARGDKLPGDLREIEAIVVLGGPMNVYEEEKYPFLKDENAFLKTAIEEGVPILGICLGAQLLAKAAGAKVKKAGQKEIGWSKVKLTEDGRQDRFFEELGETLDVFQWHEDTFDIPAGGVLLATSDICRNQAFRIGKNAYGLQFHLEVTPEMIKSWVDEYVGEKHGEKKYEMVIESYRKRDVYQKQARQLYLNFGRIIDSAKLSTV